MYCACYAYFWSDKLRNMAATYVNIDGTDVKGIAERSSRAWRGTAMKTGFRKFNSEVNIHARVDLANRLLCVINASGGMEADA
jgi:hypothetical protein